MTHRNDRLSSTRIKTRLTCHRREWFQWTDGRHIEPTFPMGVGTVTHAILEFHGLHGRRPTEEEVRSMEGNYDDPVAVLDKFADEDIWDIAVETASPVESPEEAIAEALTDAGIEGFNLDGIVHEFDLEALGLEFSNGYAAGGYLDVYVPEILPGTDLVWDWKTRSRLDYAPRTDADFRADLQGCYYPSVVARAADDVQRVIFAHGNLLRADKPGGPKLVPHMAPLDRWYLEAVWNYIDGIAHDIEEDAGKDPTEVDRNRDACYKYGKPCPHIGYCARGGKEPKPFFDWLRSDFETEEE